MSNDKKNIYNEAASNVARLSLRKGEDSHACSKSAEEASDRFFQSALQLSAEQKIEFRMMCNEHLTCTAAFSGRGTYVSTDDFRWIFARCAETVEEASDDDACQQDKPVKYVLRYTPKDTKEQDYFSRRSSFGIDHDTDSFSESYFRQILEVMKKSGSSISVQAGMDRQGDFSAKFVICLPVSMMTLRMKTMLSFAFPNTRAEIVTDGEEPGGCDIPVHCFKKYMAGIIGVLMKQKQDETTEGDGNGGESEPEPIETDAETNTMEMSTPKTGKTPIEELELSIRSYNCLKRAGIDSVEKLQTLSDEELIHIRNFTRKSMNEIKHRLKEYNIINDLDFMNAEPVQLDGPSYTDMLNKLVGLEDVKEQVRKITAFARMKQDMASLGKTDIPVALNMAFTGNPGTAKTTVARIVAGIFNEIGLLSTNEIVEVGRADLVARYEGQTADKVKSVFSNAKGKLLFIDEAYSLIENWEGAYGDEAINTIVQEMENNRNEMVVVFAGYPDKMKDFLTRNPGLKSRVPFQIHFADYTAEEMMDIARMEAKKRGFEIFPEAKEKLESICKKACGHPEMGNGRFCRNLVENAILNYASRVYGKREDKPTGEFVLTGDDFAFPEDLVEVKKAAPMGFLA